MMASDLDGSQAHLAIGQRVRIRDEPAQDGEIVDDYGDMPSVNVTLGDRTIGGARRWAVRLDSGQLKFADSPELVPSID